MNNTLKTILLIAAIVGAVFGVGMYVKTIVSPPRDIDFNNQFTDDLAADINALSVATNPNEQEKLFIKITDKLDLYKDEAMVDDDVYTAKLANFTQVYTPKFIAYCDGRFSRSQWDAADHKFMRDRIAELNALAGADDSHPALDYANDLNRINGVITDYNSALALSGQTGFNGISSTETKIRKARAYASQAPLSNCADLVQRLNALPGKIEQNHYASLQRKANNFYRETTSWTDMRHWTDQNYQNAESLANSIRAEINDYNNFSLYPSKHSSDALLRLCSDGMLHAFTLNKNLKNSNIYR